MATWNRDGVPQSSTDTYGDVTVTGKLGIGTTSPEHILHLEGDGDVGLLIRADNDNSGEQDNPLIALQQDYSAAGATGTLVNMNIGMVGDAGQIYTSSIANASYVQAQGSSGTGSDTGIMQFVTGGNNGQHTGSAAAAGTARLTILTDGKVGIGTATPSTALQVSGTVTATTFAGNLTGNLASDTTITGNLTFEASGGRDILFGDNLGAALEFKQGLDLYMRFVSTNSSEGIEMNKSLTATHATFSGNIGIGTTNPSSQLHITSATDEKPVILIEKTGSANHDGGNIQFRLKEDSGFIDNDKEIGDLQWYSYDSTDEDYNASAMIRVTASGTQAQNRAGGEMTFWTNSDTTTTSKKMTIDSAGVVTIPGKVVAKTYKPETFFAYNLASSSALSSGTEYYIPVGGNPFDYSTLTLQVEPTSNLVQTAMCDFAIERIAANIYIDEDNVTSVEIRLKKYDGSGNMDDKAQWATVGTAATIHNSSTLNADTRVVQTPSDWVIEKNEIWGLTLEYTISSGTIQNVQISGGILMLQDWNDIIANT